MYVPVQIKQHLRVGNLQNQAWKWEIKQNKTKQAYSCTKDPVASNKQVAHHPPWVHGI